MRASYHSILLPLDRGKMHTGARVHTQNATHVFALCVVERQSAVSTRHTKNYKYMCVAYVFDGTANCRPRKLQIKFTKQIDFLDSPSWACVAFAAPSECQTLREMRTAVYRHCRANSLSLSIRYIGAYKCISMCVWKFVLWIVYMDISIYYPLFSLLLGFLFCGVLAYQYEIYMFWYGWDSRLCDIDHRHTFTSINVIAGLCSVTSVPWYDLQMNAFTFDASINESSNQQSQVFFFAEFLVLLQVGQSLAGNRWQLLSVGKFEKQNALKWPANILQNKSAIRKKSCKK